MEKDLEQRTKKFSLAVIKFTALLPRTREADVLCRPAVAVGDFNWSKLSGGQSGSVAS